MRTIIALLCAVSCAAVLVGGCSTTSSGPDIPVDPQFRDRTSPENVLYNLELGYEEMNLEEYLDCLSEDFEFFPCQDDVNDPDLDIPAVWWKIHEQEMHENMFADSSDVESITLTLTVASIVYDDGDPGDPLDNTCVCVVDVDLRVNLYGALTYLATAPSLFHMRIDIDQPNPIPDPDDVLWWEINHWFDLGGSKRGAEAGRTEESSWGRIKYCFLESLSETSRRTSPAEVIDQLEAAYVAMDTVNYLDCLSGDFIFFPCEDDVQNPDMGIPSEWYKSDERTMHENMFDESSGVSSIQLTLTNTFIFWDEQDPQDPLDDIYSHTENVDLWVNLYDGYLAYYVDGPQQYLLRVDPDEEGPYGEIMWEIYEWYDLDGERGGEGADGRENTTWGGVKAMYW
jgi:hypothetical protein